ncbi:DUF6803 family protein [Chitinilyticum piscinae]|uniref:Permease n=1 Tax=Chitinilyticum piscinae TaxID=2866724 RepID=A0A8J7G0N8_9NEIS|nr:DUF6803 family protein [Chitinilyticum piscinae]MBE9609188.1 permease [Chitinilyticum piscinae]
MPMTHYMALLAANQPWNLILFMAIPVILAETVAITELYLLFTRKFGGGVHRLNRLASIAGGVYFSGIFVYLLLTAVVPLTQQGGWLGPADVIAVGFYLAGVIPLGGLALLDLGLIARQHDDEARLRLHATLVAVFLVVAHIAMIFGMLDPTLLMASGHDMAGMQH